MIINLFKSVALNYLSIGIVVRPIMIGNNGHLRVYDYQMMDDITVDTMIDLVYIVLQN